jgi:hypothetical protein
MDPERRALEQQEAEQRRIESLERSQAQLRRGYVSSLMSGQPQRIASLLPPQALVS